MRLMLRLLIGSLVLSVVNAGGAQPEQESEHVDTEAVTQVYADAKVSVGEVVTEQTDTKGVSIAPMLGLQSLSRGESSLAYFNGAFGVFIGAGEKTQRESGESSGEVFYTYPAFQLDASGTQLFTKAKFQKCHIGLTGSGSIENGNVENVGFKLQAGPSLVCFDRSANAFVFTPVVSLNSKTGPDLSFGPAALTDYGLGGRVEVLSPTGVVDFSVVDYIGEGGSAQGRGMLNIGREESLRFGFYGKADTRGNRADYTAVEVGLSIGGVIKN